MRLSGTSPVDEEDGLPLTIAATHLDGLVLALTPNHHSYKLPQCRLARLWHPVDKMLMRSSGPWRRSPIMLWMIVGQTLVSAYTDGDD